ncbi:hypothetical protein [Halomonas sp.]|uniref:phage tail tape measure protein n=1 Tax=Halomonas sp. TaxID=1486246 RepID=UPI000C8A09AF|nr:hypothetical protein [Halomonas sp.]MAR71142.1 hypothetical protein [Halomonas sp.]
MARDLKLQVILDAVDRATGPLKKITQGSGATAEALKASRDQLKTLERAQRELRGFRDLKRQSEDSSRALTDQQREVQELTRQLEQADGATGDLTRRRAQAIRQAQRLKEQYQAEQQQLQYLRTHMTRVDGVTGKLGDQQQALSRKIRDANEQLQRQQQELGEVARKQRQAADAARRYQRGMDRAGSIASAGATGLAAGGVGLVATTSQAFSNQQSGARLAARFGQDSNQAEQYRQVITTVFRSGRGEGYDQVEQAVSAIDSTFGTLESRGSDALGALTAKALTLNEVFGIDVAEAAQTAGIMVENGLAKDANAALDLIGAGFQRVSDEMKDELPEILHEYSTNFRALGYNGNEAMSLLVSAAEQGRFALDKTGDALKEFTIRGSDMSDASIEAYETIGLNAEQMADAIASGGPAAREAMQATAKGLLAIQEPAKLANAAIALFGTPIEDLSVDQIPKFLHALAGTEGTFDDVSGTIDRMALTLDNNALKALDNVRRAILGEFSGVLEDLDDTIISVSRSIKGWIEENPELASTLAKVTTGGAALVAVGGALTLALGSLLGPMVLTRYGLQMLGLKGGAFTRVLGTIAARAIPTLIGALRMLGAAAMANPILAIIGLIATGALLIWQNWDTLGPKFAALWEGIKATASDFWEWFKGIAASTRDLIIAGFTNWTLPGLILQHWDAIRASGAELWQWFQDAPGNAIEAVATMLNDWDLKGLLEEKWTAAMDYLKSLPGRMRDAGMDVARGLGEGIKNGAVSAWEAVSDAARGTEHRARYELDTHSPSRVFKSIGGDVMAGLAQGIRGSEQAPLSQVTAFSQRLRQAGAGLALGAATLPAVATADIPIDTRPPLSASAGGDVHITMGDIHVHAAPGMDEQALARYVASEVRRALDEASREAGARNRSAIYDLD